ncbi:MAG TPA: glycosyltransferase family 4 protein [Pyrinomonadaceae bacterium]|nr:glycosyltransferase family 4 protein [Pyrinomonadaceae bacterium]
MEKAIDARKLKILAVVEATTVNAVAKNMLDFHRAARDLMQKDPDLMTIETSLVTFVRPNRKAHSDNEFVKAARELGLEISVIPERFRFDTSVIPALRNIVLRGAPDIVITHQVKSHLLMKLSRLSQLYAWVAFHHGYTTTDRKMRAYNLLNRWSLPAADGVVTVCEAFARDLALAGVPRKRIHVQHNSIRPEPVASLEESKLLRQRLGIGDKEALVLTVGRLSREKAQMDLLVAFNQMLTIDSETPAKLVIVGEGLERGRLEAAATSLGLRNRVMFTGEVSNVQPYYGAADVFVLPSHSEGSPYVLLEAMSAKVPIVATVVGGVPEMVKDEESALLVPSCNPRALASAIARVLHDPELAVRLTENAYRLVTTSYAPQTQIRSLLKLYLSLLRSQAGDNSTVKAY